ncbi:unnamed protein product [Adineta ricciae]|uniref:Uncharacterized protein n=1 Tax=Adineta ricciae TaxID=249248 RepID=A0A815XKP4_ADIRI|nr:unnamed protein product [Adineta ricciae]
MAVLDASLSDTKYQWATTILEILTKQQNNGNMEKSILFSSACEIIERLLAAYGHHDPVNQSTKVILHLNENKQDYKTSQDFILQMKTQDDRSWKQYSAYFP